jgi:hypothetical protein
MKCAKVLKIPKDIFKSLLTLVAFLAGIAQLARASAFQADCRGFESRFPLK